MSLKKISSNVANIKPPEKTISDLDTEDIAFILELSALLEKMKRYAIFTNSTYTIHDIVPQNIQELVVLLTYRQRLLKDENNSLMKLQKELSKK